VRAVFPAIVVAAVLAGQAAAAPPPRSLTPVIVQAEPGALVRVEAAARRLGAVVGVQLPIVHGFSARVPKASLPALRRVKGVRAVTLDTLVTGD
jgi:hypothetical protein